MITLRPRFDGSPRGRLVLDYIKIIYCVYFAAIILTLILRAKMPQAGRVAATAHQSALLAMIRIRNRGWNFRVGEAGQGRVIPEP